MYGYPMMAPPMADPHAFYGGKGGFGFGQNQGGKGGNGGKSDGVCKFFAETGSCRFGDSCRFKHEGKASTANKITAHPSKDQDDIPNNSVLDYDNVEGTSRGAKATVCTEQPTMRALHEKKKNQNGEMIPLHKVIAACGVLGPKIQTFLLHAHTHALDDSKTEIGQQKADEILDSCIAFAKSKAPYPYRLAEDEEKQAVKDEITEVKDIMKTLATTAKAQPEQMHHMEMKMRSSRGSNPGSVFGGTSSVFSGGSGDRRH